MAEGFASTTVANSMSHPGGHVVSIILSFFALVTRNYSDTYIKALRHQCPPILSTNSFFSFLQAGLDSHSLQCRQVVTDIRSRIAASDFICSDFH